MKKIISILVLVIGALPLLGYPAVLIANIMSWAAYGSVEVSLLTKIFSNLFLWGSTFYPVIYIGSLLKYRKEKLLKYSFYYIYYIILLICIGFLWSQFDI